MNKDWLYIANTAQWLMSPDSASSIGAFIVRSSGDGSVLHISSDTTSARPVFYLTSSASITDGEGTETNPYILS